MNLAFDTTTLPGRTMRALAGLCAAACLSLGVAGAQDSKPAKSKPAKVEAKAEQAANPLAAELRARVGSGELTKAAARLIYLESLTLESPTMRELSVLLEFEEYVKSAKERGTEEAAQHVQRIVEMMQDYAYYMDVFGVSWEEASVWRELEFGTMTEREAKQKLAALHAADWVPGYLAELELTGEQVEQFRVALGRLVGDADQDAWFDTFLAGQNLTPKQLDSVRLAAKKLSMIRAEQATEWAVLERLKALFAGAGLTPKATDEAWLITKRAIAQLGGKGAGFEVDTELRESLAALGLGPERIDSIVGLCRRIAALPKEKEPSSSAGADTLGLSKKSYLWLHKSVAGGDLTPAQIEAALGALTRTIPEARAEGEAFELDARMTEYLTREGFTEAQITWLTGLVQKAVAKG